MELNKAQKVVFLESTLGKKVKDLLTNLYNYGSILKEYDKLPNGEYTYASYQVKNYLIKATMTWYTSYDLPGEKMLIVESTKKRTIVCNVTHFDEANSKRGNYYISIDMEHLTVIPTLITELNDIIIKQITDMKEQQQVSLDMLEILCNDSFE